WLRSPCPGGADGPYAPWQGSVGSVAFTSIVVRAILLDTGVGHQGNHGTLVRMAARGAQHLRRMRACAVAVALVQTRRTVNRLRGDIARAIERPSRTARPAPPRCARLPALSVPQHARAHRVERRRGDQRESLTQGCVAG